MIYYAQKMLLRFPINSHNRIEQMGKARHFNFILK